MIDREYDLGIKRKAELLDISRGNGVLPAAVGEPCRRGVVRELDELHLQHPFVGVRMLRDQFAKKGIKVGRRHVRKLMMRIGIEVLSSGAPAPVGGGVARGQTQ